MTDRSWDDLWDVFHRALELPEDERAAFVDREAGDDVEFRDELNALLGAHDDGESLDDISRSIRALRELEPEAMIGRSVGPYRLMEVIGKGGMGVVYAAEQSEPIRRRVALKLIKLGMDSREVVARFETERQALALMSHPNIANVLDAGASEDGRPYFVMEYVPGIAITEYCNRNRLPVRRRIELFIRACDAIQHAHHKGIIHRDLKPSNILVVEQDGRPEPKIIDFGVAKAVTQRLTSSTLHTRLGRLIGTPNYISPEQAEMGALDVDTRTDIYSLGVLLYELVTGSRPFEKLIEDARSPLDIPKLLQETDAQKPSTKLVEPTEDTAEVARLRSTSADRLRREVQGDLDWIILKALNHDRTRRYASADEFARDLERLFASEPVIARPPSVGYRARKFVGRHKFGVAAAALVMLALLIGLSGLTTGLIQAKNAQAIAERERNNALEVSAFLETILQSASPYVAQGADSSLLISLLEDAAERIESEVGEQHIIAANLHGTISDTYRNLGLYEEAEHHARMEVSHLEASEYGPESEQALAARAGLALVLWNDGRLEDSLAMSMEVLEQQRSLLGDIHANTMTTMNNVGIALKGLGRNEEAEAIYLELIERREEILGPTHRSTLITRNNLANLYRDWNRPGDAEPLMRSIVADSEESLGRNDPDTLAFTDSYGNILMRLGRLDEAEDIHLDVLERMRLVNGDDHPDTMGVVYHLGQLYIAQADFVNAEQQFRIAYDTVATSLGADHRYAIYALSWLAKSVMQQARWADAKALLERGVETSRQVWPDGNIDVWVFECRLGGVLVELGEPDRARSLLEGCHSMLIDVLGADAEDSRLAGSYLDALKLDDN